MAARELLDGARNCVIDCAQIGNGSAVVIVNETGTDEDVVSAIAETAREAGARVEVVWAEPFPKDNPSAKIPDDVFRAFREADVLINHYHSLSRVALQDHFPAEARVRVPNRATTSALLASTWARFPYQLQKALSETLEDAMMPGRRWRITSPGGTDLRGKFVAADSPLARAYFQTDDDNNRARRNFPGGVHMPRVSTNIQGVMVAEYVDGAPPDMPPVRLTIEDGHVEAVEGGDTEGRGRARILESDGYLDSWHCGLNPKTVVPVKRLDNPRKWYSYAHCSPQMVHFHLGRTHATINVGFLHQTLEIEGQPIYLGGTLAELADSRITKELDRSGLGADILRTEPIPF